MLRSYQDNYTLLSKVFKKEQNALLTNRLKNAKSLINTNCPYSFKDAKKKTIKSQEKNSSKTNYI